jgi:hypothetical protein
MTSSELELGFLIAVNVFLGALYIGMLISDCRTRKKTSKPRKEKGDE